MGISFDRSGLAQRTGSGSVGGLDVDIARYVARALGVDPRNVAFTPVPPTDRETALRQRTVDLVVDGFSITADRKAAVDFAGPYLIAGQALMTRTRDTDIAGPQSLDHSDWQLCSVARTTSADLIKQRYARNVRVREYPSEPRCVRALDNREVDAVTGDDVALAGYVAQQPEKYRLAGPSFSVEHYGIGLHRGDPRRPLVTAALRRMVADGTWTRIMRANLGPARVVIPAPPIVQDQP